jgi:hypothetical protein
MKKTYFDLQLFADEAAEVTAAETSADAATEQENTTKDKEPATAANPKKNEAKYTDADVDDIVKRKLAEERKKAKKEADEAAKLAAMNAEEKANYERDKAFSERDDAIRERDELKKQMVIADMAKTARKMFADEGITASDDILAMLVSDDAEKTKAAVDGCISLLKDMIEAGVKDRLKGETPKAGTSRGGNPLSEIDKRIQKYTI